jgi:hypothetical protein
MISFVKRSLDNRSAVVGDATRQRLRHAAFLTQFRRCGEVVLAQLFRLSFQIFMMKTELSAQGLLNFNA